jgi:molybdenum-dependent DNA-binding transcriptional regulator ModE
MSPVRHIPLTEAAQRLHMTYTRAWNAVLRGELEGRKEEGRWVVAEDSLKRFLTRQRETGAR